MLAETGISVGCFGPPSTMSNHSIKTSHRSRSLNILWHLLAAALGPFVVDSAYLLCTGWLYHGSGNHSGAPAFIIGIALGGYFILTLPLHWSVRIIFLVIYIPLTWAALIPFSLWLVAIVFHAMPTGG
jgi:hypothetical protein